MKWQTCILLLAVSTGSTHVHITCDCAQGRRIGRSLAPADMSLTKMDRPYHASNATAKDS